MFSYLKIPQCVFLEHGWQSDDVSLQYKHKLNKNCHTNGAHTTGIGPFYFVLFFASQIIHCGIGTDTGTGSSLVEINHIDFLKKNVLFQTTRTLWVCSTTLSSPLGP